MPQEVTIGSQSLHSNKLAHGIQSMWLSQTQSCTIKVWFK